MGVREPGLRILTHEMTVKERWAHLSHSFTETPREEMYRRGGLFSVTSRILVYDLMSVCRGWAWLIWQKTPFLRT